MRSSPFSVGTTYLAHWQHCACAQLQVCTHSYTSLHTHMYPHTCQHQMYIALFRHSLSTRAPQKRTSSTAAHIHPPCKWLEWPPISPTNHLSSHWCRMQMSSISCGVIYLATMQIADITTDSLFIATHICFPLYLHVNIVSLSTRHA